MQVRKSLWLSKLPNSNQIFHRWCERNYQNQSNCNAHERKSHKLEYQATLTKGNRRIQVEPVKDCKYIAIAEGAVTSQPWNSTVPFDFETWNLLCKLKSTEWCILVNIFHKSFMVKWFVWVIITVCFDDVWYSKHMYWPMRMKIYKLM